MDHLSQGGWDNLHCFVHRDLPVNNQIMCHVNKIKSDFMYLFILPPHSVAAPQNSPLHPSRKNPAPSKGESWGAAGLTG